MRAAIVSLAALVAACGAPQGSGVAKTADAGCEALATGAWTVGEAAYPIEARVSGPDCAGAQARLEVRSPEGASVLLIEAPAAQLFSLRDAADPAAMQTATAEWSDPLRAAIQTAADLPAWPEGGEGPAGEFPFLPEPEIDRAAYEALRAAKAPAACFVQGTESLACLAIENGSARKIGVQTFPG